MKKYRIVKTDSLSDFQRNVSDLLNDGWELHGEFTAYPNAEREYNGIFWYFQALTKVEE